MPGTYHVLGLMSGSSLDGLDLAFCRFTLDTALSRPVVEWELLAGDTIAFNDAWQEKLRSILSASASELAEAHAAFGHYMAGLLAPFLEECRPTPDLIASHGHTLFHDPSRRYTFQLGDGAALAAATGHTVVCDFRTQDIALGGQGAPLAPLADLYLLPGYDYYLNLGGIANISAILPDEKVVAFDIGGANQVLNALVAQLGFPYDDGGRLAEAGKPHHALIRELDTLPYFDAPYPKSLGNDWVQEQLLAPYHTAETPLADKLHSACIQLSGQVAAAISSIQKRENLKPSHSRILVTGGGSFNTFLLTCIEKACNGSGIGTVELVVPDARMVSCKEAALMALMGALRMEGIPNCLASVTGASRDSCGGIVHHAPAKSLRS